MVKIFGVEIGWLKTLANIAAQIAPVTSPADLRRTILQPASLVFAAVLFKC